MTVAALHRVPVLMYHEIAGATATSSPLAVAPDVFAGQLAYLREAGFAALTAGELAAFLADGTGELPERPIVLTFDDGYQDFYTHGLPVLKRNGFTATLFMTTGGIGDESLEKIMLNWRELSEVEQAGIEIGAHTVTHPKLDILPEKDLREELSVSKSQLEDHFGRAIPGLAYPFGYSNRKVREVARELGYTYAYSVDNALTTSSAGTFTFPRLTVQRTTTMDGFAAIVNGKNTAALRRDRTISRLSPMVRRAKSTLGIERQPEWYFDAKAQIQEQRLTPIGRAPEATPLSQLPGRCARPSPPP
ncbi:MAG: polysaccharide deacetylase family protein [Trebonia sp.]